MPSASKGSQAVPVETLAATLAPLPSWPRPGRFGEFSLAADLAASQGCWTPGHEQALRSPPSSTGTLLTDTQGKMQQENRRPRWKSSPLLGLGLRFRPRSRSTPRTPHEQVLTDREPHSALELRPGAFQDGL